MFVLIVLYISFNNKFYLELTYVLYVYLTDFFKGRFCIEMGGQKK
jgi:hypothetical protein